MQQAKKLTLQHDGLLTIAVGSSRKETDWKNREMLWSQFLERLRQPRRTGETFAEYQAMPKEERDAIKDAGGFVGGPLKGGRRKRDCVSWRQVVTLDADFIKGDLWAGIETMFDYGCAVYTTHSHSPKRPRMRLIIPLQRPATPEEYPALGRALAAMVGINFFDDTTYEPHRLMYWPSASDDGEFLFRYQDAPWVEPDRILATYPDWRDSSYWPESDRQKKERKRQADKAGNPLEKKGVIGAFCRVYSVPQALEAFLADVYAPAADNRYTYLEGSTSGGLVLYEDGLFCYSHHGTDPIGGRLVNSFDLVRIHKFGAQDDGKEEETAVTSLPSFQAMQEFALQDPAVKQELAETKLRSAAADFDDDETWTSRLTFTKNGELEKTITNAELIIRHDPDLQAIAFNGHRQTPVLRGEVPWREPEKLGPIWQDSDDAALRSYLERVYNFYAPSKVHDALTTVSMERYFHPIREYLDDLPAWDGVVRAETLLIDYLGAPDSIYTREATRKTLVAAIARVMEPGCKFDTMLVLNGPQGAGKSTLYHRLAGEWFSDSLTMTDTRDKTGIEKLQGYWIIEIGELAGIRFAEVQKVKSFLSSQRDVCRFAYARRTVEVPRQCVIVGSTNGPLGYLRDTTGNRRFWPINVQKVPFEQASWNLTQATVDQVWAEVLQCYRSGERLFLVGQAAKEAEAAQQEAMEQDERAEMVETFLDTVLPLNWHDMDLSERRQFLQGDFGRPPLTEGMIRDRICAAEIWCECFGRSEQDLDYRAASEIYSILAQLKGWERYDGGSRGRLRFSLYGSKLAYVRKESV